MFVSQGAGALNTLDGDVSNRVDGGKRSFTVLGTDYKTMESTVKGMLDVAEQFRDHTFDFQMSNAELIEVVAKDVAEFKKRLADSYRFLFKKQYKQLKKSRAQELKA